MAELILLCAGAAVDRERPDAANESGAADPRRVRRELARGAFVHAFARASCAVDRQDEALLPRELPQDAWWRERCAIPEHDALEAYAALALGAELPGWRLTPAHVHIGLDQARLSDPSALALREDESRELARVAAPLFEQEGFALNAPAPQAWFLEGEPGLQLVTRSWAMAAGRNVDAYLPAGPDARRWRRLLTEIQMSWFNHPVNLERETRGDPPVNMLWIDGHAAGRLPPRALTVLSADPALAGLARAGGGQAIDSGGRLPDASELVAIAAGSELVVDVDGWNAARRGGSPEQWAAAWLRLERWIAATGLDRGPPPGFSAMRAVLTGERRRLEMLVEPRRWLQWRRRLDPLELAL